MDGTGTYEDVLLVEEVLLVEVVLLVELDMRTLVCIQSFDSSMTGLSRTWHGDKF